MATPATAHTSAFKRICPICEAGCGLSFTADGRTVTGVQPNADDVFSVGHACPKGIALAELDADPDRLRSPLIRRNGRLEPASWNEAFTLVNERLGALRETYGAGAVAVYIGNPSAHNIGLAMGLGVLAGALGTPQVYSAGSVDQVPKQLASELMFGNDMAVPVPDIERCDLLLMLGANPVVSNGSLWMVPKIRDRLRALRARGGQLITVDPRRTETARLADRHVFIRPGSDAWLLAALINTLRAAGRQIDPRYRAHGGATLWQALDGIDAAAAAARTGISVDVITQLADSLLAARRPVVYGRVGTTLQAHGTLTSFLVEVLNLLTGQLDADGGAMFPEQAFTQPGGPSPGPRYGRYHSRVSQRPEVLGQFPVAVLAEEIETPGQGQVRALITLAGNPLVSNPDSERLQRAVAGLDFMLSVDIYRNETTELADVILPGTSPFEDCHYDQFLGAMGYRNTARFSPAVFATDAGRPDEWTLALTLAYGVAHGVVPDDTQLAAWEDNLVAANLARHSENPAGPLYGRDLQELLAAVGPQRGVERLLDVGIRAGRWGDHFGARDGLTLAQLAACPDGVDFGPPRTRLDEVVGHADGGLQLAPPLIIDDVARLRAAAPTAPGVLLLVGRRNVRTNNSWLHNLPELNRGREICVLQMHADDAAAVGISSGDQVRVTSDNGSIEVRAEVDTELARGVVCLPHGFSALAQAGQHTRRPGGVNYNLLAATAAVDVPSGTAALNGIAVRVERLAATAVPADPPAG